MDLPNYVTKPLFWVGSSVAAILAPLLLLAVAVAGIELAFNYDEIIHPTTEADVRSLIDAEVDAGATTSEIFAFLQRHEIEYGDISSANESSIMTEAGHSGSTKYIGAIIRDTRWYPIGDVDIQIFFVLDDSEQLAQYVIRESVTSL